MLKLKGITKTYQLGELDTHALKGINLEFRKSEFVAILGPSGCGKTTLLNIVGGLDHYTDGDLIIDGISTKEYKDKDWDTYRNHKIGFVFQSYNLIPHLTVLENVELALTLSGVSKKERKEKAKKALEQVGLGDKLQNRPNQLSGGQMQRVAIARALVNDPEIILADEPTGALDTQSSLVVMNILKEISKNKLIIMVTHNPDLATQYSNRIVRLLDGNLVDDTNPYISNTSLKTINQPLNRKGGVKIEVIGSKNKESDEKQKTKMSFFTALSLSFKNLLTKKARTILVSFAGSIGIIGIALILSISSGFNTYVNKIQEDTLSSYPITIESQSVDFTSIMAELFTDGANKKANHEKDAVYSNDSISKIMNTVGGSLNANNLNAFTTYIKEHEDELKEYINAIKYSYNLDLDFFNTEGEEISSSNAILSMITKYALYYFANETHSSFEYNADGSVTIKKLENFDSTFIDSYPDSLKPLLTAKGYLSTGEATLSSTEVVSMAFTIIGMSASSLSSGGSSGMGLTSTNIFSEMIDNDELIQSQYDILAGRVITANETDNNVMLVLDSNNELDDYLLYALGLIEDNAMDENLKNLVEEKDANIKINYNSILGKKYKILIESDYYIEENETIVDFRTYNSKYVNTFSPNPNYNPVKYKEYYDEAIANAKEITIVGILRLNDTTKNGSLSEGIVYSKSLTEKMINYHNTSKYVQENTTKKIELDTPSSIQIYVSAFESKEKIQEFIETYNNGAEKEDKISYTDYVGIIMGSVSTIINAITYILIAFVSVSLIVSSIMIAIITYISVIERTKEIGVLRAIGASKGDIKHVFIAESFIIGLASGTLGVLVTILLNIPINIILNSLTNLGTIAVLPTLAAFILVAISIILTLIAGFVPSRMAAKKDPVIALRTE